MPLYSLTTANGGKVQRLRKSEDLPGLAIILLSGRRAILYNLIHKSIKTFRTALGRRILYSSLLSIFCILPQGAKSQSLDSLQTIEETVVRSGQKESEHTGQETYVLKLNASQSTLADALQAQSPFFIKSYGAGLLASTSIRGSGAAHTPIFWNGINIQSPMNGQVDLNLLPSFFFDQATVYAGGASDRFGSGALGGVISLRGNALTKNKAFLVLGGEFGSFGQSNFKTDAGYHHKKIALRLRHYSAGAKNDYTYINRGSFGWPKERLNHAASNQEGLLIDLDWKIANQQSLAIHYWNQRNYRELPPTMLEAQSVAVQKDASQRLVAEWNGKFKSGNYSLRTAFLQDALNYINMQIPLNSKSLSFGAIQDFEWWKEIKKNTWFFSLQNTFYSATQAAYGNKKEQNRQAIDASWKREFGNWKLRAALRQEVLDFDIMPFGAAIGSELRLNKKWKLRGQISKVYRIPNFNDLYWVPGGNPEIKSEEGYAGEIGTNYLFVDKANVFEAKLTAYASLIDNWIIWLPKQGIWTAQNLKKVFSRGAEYQFKYGQFKKKWNWILRYNGSFTLAENTKETTPGDASIGKQLIYVPFWKNTVIGELTIKKLNFQYSHLFSGGVYTSSDNSSFIKPWQTGSLRLSYQQKFKHNQFQLSASIENIGNTQYEVIEWRPMPGRWFRLGIQWTLSK